MRNNKNIILLLLIILYLIFRVPLLGSDLSNTDAFRWHTRSEKFLVAIKSLDFNNTYQHYQPGVTLMWLNAFVKQSAFSFQYHVLKEKTPKTLESSNWYPIIHFYSKLALVLTLTVLLINQYFMIKNIFNAYTGLVYVFLVAVEPYLIGIDRWFHLTSLETYLSLCAFLSLLLWKKNNKYKNLIYSAVLFGLAILTKISAVILIPLLLFILVRNEKNRFKNVVLFSAVVCITLCIVFPALITSTFDVISRLVSAIFTAGTETNRNPSLSPFIQFIFYDLIFIYKLSLANLLIFIYSIFDIKKIIKTEFIGYLYAYFFSYYVFLSLSTQKIDRYSISMFLIILLIVAVYVVSKSRNLIKLLGIYNTYNVVLASFIFFPIFSAYYSPIFGGTTSAIKLGIYDNSGEYYADAAKYLNAKGRNTLVYIPNSIISFKPFFGGNVTDTYNTNVDYAVTSFDNDRMQVDILECPNLEKSFGNRDRNIVFVYKCKYND